MSGIVQLDLFDDRPNRGGPSDKSSVLPIAPDRLSDEALILAIDRVTLTGADAVTAEAGRRQLVAAVPALESLCAGAERG